MIDTAERPFVPDVDRKLVERSPGFDKAQWPNMADQTWGAEEVSPSYGAQPHWT